MMKKTFKVKCNFVILLRRFNWMFSINSGHTENFLILLLYVCRRDRHHVLGHGSCWRWGRRLTSQQGGGSALHRSTKCFSIKSKEKTHKEKKKTNDIINNNNSNNNNLASKFLLYYLLDETVATDWSFELLITFVWRLTLDFFFSIVFVILFICFCFVFCYADKGWYVCVNDFWHINVAPLHLRDNEALVASVVL